MHSTLCVWLSRQQPCGCLRAQECATPSAMATLQADNTMDAMIKAAPARLQRTRRVVRQKDLLPGMLMLCALIVLIVPRRARAILSLYSEAYL
jgi:hypothetical protein